MPKALEWGSNFDLDSNMMERTFWRARPKANASPTGPPPTIRTGVSFILKQGPANPLNVQLHCESNFPDSTELCSVGPAPLLVWLTSMRSSFWRATLAGSEVIWSAPAKFRASEENVQRPQNALCCRY